jgi:hypothetical protein
VPEGRSHPPCARKYVAEPRRQGVGRQVKWGDKEGQRRSHGFSSSYGCYLRGRLTVKWPTPGAGPVRGTRLTSRISLSTLPSGLKAVARRWVDNSWFVGKSKAGPLSDLFTGQPEIHRLVTCFAAPGIMILLGLCAPTLGRPLASARANPASIQAGRLSL